MPIKIYSSTASFLKISTTKATVYSEVQMFLHMYLLQSLSNLGEIQYKECEHNADEQF